MKKSLLVCLIMATLVASCGWLQKQVGSESSTPAVKTQICPDDPLACR